MLTRAGPGGNLGADLVAKAPADGYTLLSALDTTFTVNPAVYKKMPFDVTKDFAVISVPVTCSQVLAVNPSIKANTVAEFVKLAKTTHLSQACSEPRARGADGSGPASRSDRAAPGRRSTAATTW